MICNFFAVRCLFFSVPVSTYFIVSDDSNTKLIDRFPDGGEICPNLTFLGRYGIRNINGMKIGYLSGKYNSELFNKKNENTKDSFSQYYTTYDLKRLDFSKIDIFLTSEWGRGFHYGISHGFNTVNKLPTCPPLRSNDCSSIGSPIVSKLAVKMSPQYHFAANEDCFYTLLPYLNNKTPNVTRFIALGNAISKQKEKQRGIYACNVIPLQSLTDEKYNDLSKQNSTSQVTQCPYTLPFKKGAIKQKNASSSSSFSSSNEKESKENDAGVKEPPFKRQRLSTNNSNSNNNNNRYNNDDDQPLKKVYHTGLYGNKRYNNDHYHNNNRNNYNNYNNNNNNNGNSNRYGNSSNISNNSTSGHRWQTNVPPKDYVCYRCGISGHFIQDCPSYLANRNRSDWRNNSHGNNNSNNMNNNNNNNNNNNGNRNYTNNSIPGGSRDDYFFEKFGGRRAMKRAKRSGGECWFCLGSSKVESHMIISIGDHTYVALAKGSLINDHVLIVPINHLQNSQKFTPGVRNEINKFLICLEKCYQEKKNKSLLICDRNLPTKYQSAHGYLEIFGIDNDKLNGLGDTLTKEASKEGIEFKTIDKNDNLGNHIGPFGYIVLHNRSGGRKYVHSVQSGMKKISLNFLRRVVAVHLNLPQKAEWTACIVDKQQETKITDDIKTLFKPYDWTLRR